MRAIKSHYAENRKVNTDPYANWQILLLVKAGWLFPLLSPAPLSLLIAPAHPSPPRCAPVLPCSLLIFLLLPWGSHLPLLSHLPPLT